MVVEVSGIDCATRLDAVSATCLREVGHTFVIRYFDDSWNRSPKCLTEQEAGMILAVGLELLPIFETDPTSAAYFSRSKGMEDGSLALTSANNILYPHGLPILFAVDFDASPADVDAIREYFNGVFDVLKDLHPIGVYGPWNVIERAAKEPWPAVPYRWQAYAPAWSGGANAQRHPAAHIIQVANGQVACGIAVDRDEKQTVDGLTIVGWKGASTMPTDDEIWAAIQRLYLGKIEELIKPTVRVMTAQDPETRAAAVGAIVERLKGGTP